MTAQTELTLKRKPSFRFLFSDPWKGNLPDPNFLVRGKTPTGKRGRKPSSKSQKQLASEFMRKFGRTPIEVFRAWNYSQAVWRAFRAALAILIDGNVSFSVRKPHHLATLRALEHLAKVICNRALTRGPDDCSTWLKGQLTECRSRVVTKVKYKNDMTSIARLLAKWSRRPFDHALLQLSYISRALPRPTMVKTLRASLQKHREVFTAPNECPDRTSVEASVYAFSYEWAKRKKQPDASWDIQVTGGAAIGFPKAKGGHQANIAGAVWEQFADTTRPEWVEPDVWQTLAGLANVRLALETRLTEKFNQPGFYPPGEVIPLAEAGNKVRIVSKGDSDFVTMTHSLRDLLFQLLRQDPTVSTSIAGKDIQAVESLWKETLGRKEYLSRSHVISSDMTMATDGIYQEVYRACWYGIADAIELSPKARALGALAIGPQRMKWPILGKDGKTVDYVEGVTSRGAPMGNPLPWSLLNIIHRWAAETAISKTLKGRPGFLFRKAPYRIFGDDAIAVWPLETEQVYRSHLESIGAEISKTKHFISGPLSVPQYGTFCEKAYLFDPDQELPVRTKTYPLRGIVHAGGAVQEVGRPKDRGLPAWATVGPTQKSLLDYDPSGFRGIRWAMRYSCPGLSKWYIQKGIFPYLPRELGGAGLIPRKGYETRISEVAPKRVRKVLSDMYCSESPNTDWDLFSKAWKVNQVGRHQRLAVEFTTGVFDAGAYQTFWKGAILPDGYEDVQLTRREVEDKLTHWWRKGFLLLMGPDPQKGWKLKPLQISKDIRKVIASYKTAEWANPLQTPSVRDVMTRRDEHNSSCRCARRVTTAEGVPLSTEVRPYDEVHREVLDELYNGREPTDWNELIQMEELIDNRRQPDLLHYSDSLIKGKRAGSAISRQREIALALGWEAFMFERT